MGAFIFNLLVREIESEREGKIHVFTKIKKPLNGKRGVLTVWCAFFCSYFTKRHAKKSGVPKNVGARVERK